MEKKRSEELDRILKNHILAATGAGLIPVPLADIAGLITVQSNMIKEIAKIYEVPFIKETVKNALSKLIGRLVFTNVLPWLASAVKFIPIIGTSAGTASMPIACGASTYATGKVFIHHFESGGTFMTFDPEKVKKYYAEMLKEGKNVAANLKKNDS